MGHEKGSEENRILTKPQTKRVLFNVRLGVGKSGCGLLCCPKSYPFDTHLTENYGFISRPIYFGKKNRKRSNPFPLSSRQLDYINLLALSYRHTTN